MKKIIFLAGLFVWFASCQKEKPTTIVPTGGLYVINEGNFMFGNAEISFYDPVQKSVINGLFSERNGFQLGDVAQSMYIMDSTGYIVVNNSTKIEVVRLPELKWIRTLTIPNSSPRYFLPVNDSIAYVTELYAKKIWIINYRTGVLKNTLTVQGWTEKMYLAGMFVFVQQKVNSLISGSEGNILKINISNHSIVKTAQINGRNVFDLTTDGQGRLWASLAPDSAAGIKPAIVCYDNDLNPIKTYTFDNYNRSAWYIAGEENGVCYYTQGGIYRVNIQQQELSSIPVIQTDEKNVYALFVNRSTGEIYFSDALDYVQPSQIYRYDKNGNFVHQFTAGVIAGNFALYEP
ncbi:MAG: hypothetical protein NZM35_09410 [Chitinophagales bacterium]|nr:hypothetical protein [Chitinophagales bacterium]MDW8419508.1 hypothetical protein [Chitinophagales bacterium]